MTKVSLYFENGLMLEAKSFGAEGTSVGEIVFNTSLTGYQEIVTDPSYAGQFVTFTMPEIGNVGCNTQDMESKGAHCKGIIVRSYQDRPSNFRCEETLADLLKRENILGITEIDTRFLTKMLRDEGAMMMVASTEISDKEELKKVNNFKTKLINIAAHDLKNPFNALVSYTNLLRFDFEAFSKEELSQIITDMNDASEQGFALLENLLYWTRSQTNRMKVYKTFFKLNQIVDDVINLASPNLTTKSQTVKVDIEENLQVFADKDMIATVIRNLIFNSIKFSYANTEIRVEAKKAGNSIQVSVIDQGVGIAADKQQKFFNYEENTTTTGTAGETGSGLGLIICREFIEKNNGLIWVESEAGKGATFRFSIPYVDPPKKTTKPVGKKRALKG